VSPVPTIRGSGDQLRTRAVYVPRAGYCIETRGHRAPRHAARSRAHRALARRVRIALEAGCAGAGHQSDEQSDCQLARIGAAVIAVAAVRPATADDHGGASRCRSSRAARPWSRVIRVTASEAAACGRCW
jgi:hypothetical protein